MALPSFGPGTISATDDGSRSQNTPGNGNGSHMDLDQREVKPPLSLLLLLEMEGTLALAFYHQVITLDD